MFHTKFSKLQEAARARRPVLMVFGALFIGVLAGYFLFSNTAAHAGILDDIKNFFSPSSVQGPAATPAVSQPPLASSHEEAVVNAVQKAAPAVVSITVSKNVPVLEQCQTSPFSGLPSDLQQFFGGSFQLPQVCQRGTQLQEIGGGSGFIVSADGYILTNKHVVDDTKAEYTVLTNDGKKYAATVVARHPSLDIAIIKISANGLPVISLGESNGLRLGQTAIAIGNALGEFRNTVSVGVVSGLARSVTASSGAGTGTETIENVIQTDAAINPGNSGGPLLNSAGQVIGINTAMVSGAQGIGFAIPIDAAKKSIESVSKTGTIQVAYLGIRYVMLTPDLAKQYKLSVESGALVKGDGKNLAVEPGSPAAKAGLREGDVITKIDGADLGDQLSLSSVVSQKNPGDTIRLSVLRDGKAIEVDVLLGKRA
jgi:serine protease Do